MDQNNPYFRQVSLLVSILPVIAEHSCFALKGGTAINLFLRDLPRLSVDIDLVYLPVEDRQTSLNTIDEALLAIKEVIEHRLAASVQAIALKGTDKHYKLQIFRDNASVKIEVTPVLRGSVLASEDKAVSKQVEAHFGLAEMQLLSFEDIYAGKLCAALDRQHPRDLFDVKLLLENEGISKQMMRVFLVYLIGHSRPMAELLDPRLIDFMAIYQSEFEGMVIRPVSQDELEQVRTDMIKLIKSKITDKDKQFLLSVKNRDPQWEYLAWPHVSKLPAVLWKMHNLAKMDKKKHQMALDKLEKVLYG
jgi:predicted nucleotidyltransferase component of viral defense system